MSAPNDVLVMAVEERKEIVLRLLEESGLALPPKAVYLNLKMRGFPFGERTVKSYLYDLRDGGYLEHPEEKDDYYQITDRGRAYLEDDLDTETPD